jgi:D-alanyl-D-alanine carboxypeptidase
MQKKAGMACYGLRLGVFSLIAAVAVVSVSADPADARGKRKRAAKAAAVSSYSPPYSDIVVDANTGAILHSTSPDAPRHPASLTKIMTLYMLFEQLEAGKMSLETEMPVSVHAAAQAPSKLYVKPGQTISADDAIKAIVTRSANDVAVVVAEALGGTEDNFGKLMTAKARSLGMQNTFYKNASGLPDDAQITTARDQALLGRVIQDRFPKYYAFFSTSRFVYRGNTIGNHNRLLGKVEGVDGIKTGYTNASGFNLVTSLRRSGRHVVAVVLGGRSASSRDERMRVMINDYIQIASTKRTAPVIAEGTAPKRSMMQRIAAAVVRPARAEIPPAPFETTPVATVPASSAAPGSDDPLEPITVRTVSVKPGTPISLAAPTVTASVPQAAPSKGPVMAFSDPGQDRQPGVLGTMKMKVASAMPMPMPMPVQPVASSESSSEMRASAQRSGWMIQIGAFDREDEAKHRLTDALSRAKSVLGTANGFTERVAKGEKTLYRARFAGLGKEQAEAACQYLKKNEIACMALKN